MWTEYGLDGVDALRIILSTIAFYVIILLIVRFLGQRALATLSSFDLAAIIALGAIMGRAILGDSPTAVAGVLSLVTLVALQAVTGQLRRHVRGAWLVNSPPVILMAGPRMIAANLTRAHVVEDEVLSALRLAGIRHLDEVACVTLEPTGRISVLRTGESIDPALLAGAVGLEHMPAGMLRDRA